MAITQSSLAEDPILSRHERVALRGIYRAAQLAEALMAVEKVCSNLTAADLSASFRDKTDQLKANLRNAMMGCLVSIKLPTTPLPDKVG